MPRALRLESIRLIAFVGGLGDAVEEQITKRIRREIKARKAAERRHLDVERPQRTQIAHDAVVRDLSLDFVQIRAGKKKLAVRGQDAVGTQTGNPVETRRPKVALVRELEYAVGRSEDGCNRALFVDDVLCKSKAVPLL